MHGGIGRSINHIEQIESLQRPITMEAGSIVLMDLLWLVHNIPNYVHLKFLCFSGLSVSLFFKISVCRSDPTENDSVEGLRPNARGPGLVTFGVSVVFCSYVFANFSSSSFFGCVIIVFHNVAETV